MKSCTKSITLVLCAVACLTSGRAAFGQNAQGTILGHVTDPSGAPVTAAEVALTNIDRNVSQVTHTSDVGDYVFVDVQPGNYTLKLTAAGFKTAQATGLKLGVDQTLRQNFDLAIGTLNEQVSVQADAQMVQTDNTTVGTTFNQELISELPISGRDISNLLRVQAGASIMGGGPAWAWTMHGLNTDYLETSINGARPESISYLIDGITNNDQFFASPSNLPSSFAVSEFKSQNGLYSAEYGQGSAQVNIAIRQGTNDYHGNAYDFLQNDFFQPESPLNKFLNQENPSPTPLPLKNTLKQNQFGFTLGGPLVIPKLYNGRNKSFFFFSADWGIIRQAQPSSITVPTQQERTGNFSDWPYPIYDPSTTVVNSDGSITRTPFPGNIIPSSEISPIANSILKYVPVPNSTCANPCSSGGNYRISVPKPWDTHAYSMRGDQLLSEKDRLFFTGVIGQQSFINTSIMPLSGEVKYTWDDLFGLNWQHTFTPTIFNEARFGYNRLHFEDSSATSNGPNIAAQLGFANTPNLPEFYGPPIISWSGYQTLGNGNSGWFQNNHIYEWVDNLKIVTGRHTFTMGVDLRRLQLDLIDGYGVEGSLGFNGAFTALDPSAAGSPGPTAGNSFADFLLGQVQNASHPANVGADKYDVRGMNWNFFVQDDLRITPKLTLNLGLRYEIPPAFRSLDKSGVGLDQSNGGGFIWANSSFVQQVSSQPGVNQNLIRCCAPTSLVPQDWHDFAPRIGFAWRPFDSDRFVIRPAYGIFYDIYSRYYELTTYDEDYLYTAPSFSYPNIPGNSKTSPVQLDGLWSPLTNAQNYGYFQLPGWQANGQINYPGNKSPRTQQWSLDTQFALNQNTILDVGYIGSRASHENGYWYFNAGYLPTVPGDVCNTLRSVQEAQQSSPGCLTDPNFQPVDTRNPYPNIGSQSYANANIFWSTYNSLQARFIKRYSHGLQYQLNYTFSKALDTLSVIGLQYGANSFIQNPHNIGAEYGPANFDQTHRLVATGSYEIPVGKGKLWDFGKWNLLLGGWQASGIYTISSGLPYTIYGLPGGNDQLGLVRQDDIRANLVGDPNAVQKTIFEQFNTAAFASPIPGTFGTLGRDTMRTPFYTDLDMAFGKNFRLSERATLKYKLEVFNLTSTWRQNENLLFGTDNRVSDSPAGCTSGPSGNCSFGSLVPLNGAGSLNLFNPRVIQMSLNLAF